MTEEAGAVEESYEELYEDAPCGYLSLLPDGRILRANRTLLAWTGYGAEEIRAGKRFPALLTVPSALLYETHCAPLLRLRGSIGEIALDLLCRDGTPLPVLFSAVALRGPSGAPGLFRVVVLRAPTRREYERELQVARAAAEDAADLLRAQREVAEHKLAEQDRILQAMGRMAAGDLETPVSIDPGSSLWSLAGGLEQMRRDILGQIRQMEERNAEILHLNAELRHQIEQRSRLLGASMQPAASEHHASAGDASAEALPIFPRGTLLAGRYRVETLLGRGAMGTVYEVERISDGRGFAAKVLNVKPDYLTMARFAREAELLARLQHPNLITIVDVDVTADRVAYLVMERVHGASLAELGDRYCDRDFMVPVLGQIASALAAVHAAGIVHRDLKPANVLVEIHEGGAQATAKLADFGISRLLDLDPEAPGPISLPAGEIAVDPPHPRDTVASPHATFPAPAASERFEATLDVRGPPANLAPAGGAIRRRRPPEMLTQAGMLVGTPWYMAPELLGGANLARPSSDVFSFGIMAYEVLTGSMPFERLPWLQAARGELHFEPLDHRCRGLSPAIARLLGRCLALDPASRPTAAELSEALVAR